MSEFASMTAMCKCTMGTSPTTLVVLPTNMTFTQMKPAATILDAKPMLNLPTFGMCMSLANPMVAAATAAALGVLTPMPCIPMTQAWLPGYPMALIKGKPATIKPCKAICAYAGVVSIEQPGQAKAQTA